MLDFAGRDHTITAAGLNPLPVQRPIPIWIGGSSEAALRRIARLGDGWFPMNGQALEGGWASTIERMREWRREAGRDADDLGIEPRISACDRNARRLARRKPRSGGRSAPRTSRSTRCAAGSYGADAHVERLAAVKDALGS